MQSMVDLLNKFNIYAQKITAKIIIISLAFMTAIVFTQVIFRYIVHVAIPWSYELSRYLMIWITFLGAYLGLVKGSHASISIIAEKLPRIYRKWNLICISLIILIVIIVLGWYGLKQAWVNRLQLSPSLRLPMFWPYLAIPVSCFLMLLSMIEKILKLIKSIFG